MSITNIILAPKWPVGLAGVDSKTLLVRTSAAPFVASPSSDGWLPWAWPSAAARLVKGLNRLHRATGVGLEACHAESGAAFAAFSSLCAQDERMGFASGRYSTSLVVKNALRPASDCCQHYCQLQRRVPAFCFGRQPQCALPSLLPPPSQVNRQRSRAWCSSC